jgi:aldose 1-epimerase
VNFNYTSRGKVLRIAIALAYTSGDMEGGYPGNLKVTVVYTLTDENGLIIYYSAMTDKQRFTSLKAVD